MKYLLFIVLLVAVVITAGCISDNKNTIVTPTQTTPAPTIIVTTTVPTVVITSPISKFCDDLNLNYNDDLAFMDFVTDYAIITRISTLPFAKQTDYYTYGCDKTAAISLNQLILSHAKPKSPTLIQVRELLISATTYCQIPDSSSASRTREDLNRVSDKLDEYLDKIAPCRTSGSAASSGSTGTLLYGNGDDVRSFTVTDTGLRIFTMTGTHNFAAVLKDSGGNYVTQIANGSNSPSVKFVKIIGKRSKLLTSGTYYLDITADGAWTIDISSM